MDDVAILCVGLTNSNMQRFKDSITGELWLGRAALKDTMKEFF